MGSILISVLALGFTLYSFWWMNWRRGKLLVVSPRAYAACCQDMRLLIQLPLVFYNSGPTPILIENLQLRFTESDTSKKPLYFNATVEKLATDENRAFATQFPIPGNSTLRLICEFQKKEGSFGFEEHNYHMALDVRLYECDWETIKRFDLNVDEAAAVALATGRLVARDNHL